MTDAITTIHCQTAGIKSSYFHHSVRKSTTTTVGYYWKMRSCIIITEENVDEARVT
jgi:hypothetical protein